MPYNARMRIIGVLGVAAALFLLGVWLGSYLKGRQLGAELPPATIERNVHDQTSAAIRGRERAQVEDLMRQCPGAGITADMPLTEATQRAMKWSNDRLMESIQQQKTSG
jgi:hypothetical protein